MANYNVTNRGERTRYRLGYEFRPGETVAVEASDRQFRVLRATRGLEAEGHEGTSGDTGNPDGHERPVETPKDAGDTKETAGAPDVSDLNIDEVLPMVEDGHISAADALEQEKAGKNRPTLVQQLQDMQDLI